MFDLTGRRVLVTGASRGAGFGIAKAFVAAGAEVVATARNQQGLDRLRQETGAAHGKVTVVPGDLTTRAGAREVARRSGEIDILINNAAVTTAKLASSLLEDDAGWDLQFAVNTVAPVTLMQSLVPGMAQRGGGVVINISSIAAQRPNPLHPHYAASKAALEAASRAIAIDYGSRGVRINCVALGLTHTEALDEMLANGATVEAVGRIFTPIGRVTQPSEVAALCMYLASDAAAPITGTVITVDGGITAGTFEPPRGDTGLVS